MRRRRRPELPRQTDDLHGPRPNLGRVGRGGSRTARHSSRPNQLGLTPPHKRPTGGRLAILGTDRLDGRVIRDRRDEGRESVGGAPAVWSAGPRDPSEVHALAGDDVWRGAADRLGGSVVPIPSRPEYANLRFIASAEGLVAILSQLSRPRVSRGRLYASEW